MKKMVLFRILLAIALFVYVAFSGPLVIKHIENTFPQPLSISISITTLLLLSANIVFILLYDVGRKTDV